MNDQEQVAVRKRAERGENKQLQRTIEKQSELKQLIRGEEPQKIKTAD